MSLSRGPRRWLIITGVVVIVVLLASVAGIGWYYSSVLLDPDRHLVYPDRLVAASESTVTLAPSPLTRQAGIWGVDWAGGGLLVGGVLRSDAAGVVRPILSGRPPADGTTVTMDPVVYRPDPTSRGLPFSAVTVPTSLGSEPAWFVPPKLGPPKLGREDGIGPNPDDTTWIIAVHGRGSSEREVLRILPTLHAAGYPVLAISYRNDAGSPASPDGRYHLGDTEWQDIEAAVDYATTNGAKRVVLYAWSMGGAIAGAYLDRAPNATQVQAVILDAPVLDWRAVLLLQTRNRNLPALLTPVAEWFTTRRIGIDFDRFELLRHPPRVRPPTLLFHGSADTTVPVQPARDLAAAATRLEWPLTYVEVGGAEHTASWNVNPNDYQQRVAEFLATSAPTGR